MTRWVMEVLSIRQHGNNFYGKNFHLAHVARMKKKLIDSLVGRESTPVKVGPRITAVREALALSKAQFADSIELDRSTLSKVENGKTGLDIAAGERIASIYGIGLDYVYRGELSDLPSDLRPRVLVELANARSALKTR